MKPESGCHRLAAGQAGLDLGAVLRHFLPGFLAAHPRAPMRKQRLLRRMALCRSGALGSTVVQCSRCGHRDTIALGCGDRHCPSCQASHARRWLASQIRWLLPVAYYHVVFTLPHELHPLLLGNQKALYKLLFDSASQTLLAFSHKRLGGNCAITAILHTWGQQMGYHPHLHCIVSGGALSADGTAWRRSKQHKYLFPQTPIALVFRGKFMAGLRKLRKDLRLPEGFCFQSLEASLYQKAWNIFLKRPFGGPEQVLAYLSNYTHRVAISNSRILSIDQAAGTVTISYRDYAQGGRVKTRVLDGAEFIRRFCLHILPRGFTKVRHYGLLANNRKAEAIPAARSLIASKRCRGMELPALARQDAQWAPKCTCCNAPTLRTVFVITPWKTLQLRPIDTS